MLVSPAEERRANAEKIKSVIPELEIVCADISKDDLWEKHLATMLTNPSEYDGVVMMEDDVILCENFRERLAKVVAKHQNDVIQFFERALSKTPLTKGYQPGSNFFSCVCYYMPAPLTQLFSDEGMKSDFKKWFAKRDEPWSYPIDRYIAYVLGAKKLSYWRESPYLVQHSAMKSTLGNRSTKRQSRYFVDDLERKIAGEDDVFSLRQLSYDQMLPYNRDYRIILHPPAKNRQYIGLRNKEGNTVAVCEVTVAKGTIHIGCVFVPEMYRGNHYACILIRKVLCAYNGMAATAQCNDWSIRTFLMSGFYVTSTRKCKYWTAYFVRRDAVEHGKTEA